MSRPGKMHHNTCFAKIKYFTLQNERWTRYKNKKNIGSRFAWFFGDQFSLAHERIIIIINFTTVASIEASKIYRDTNQQFLIRFTDSRYKNYALNYVDRNDCDHFGRFIF